MKVFIIVAHVPLITAGMASDWLFPFWIDQAVPCFWVISAFLFVRAMENHGSDGPRDELCFKRLAPRLLRIAAPYTVIFVLLFILVIRRTDVASVANSLLGLQLFGESTSVLNKAAAATVMYLCGGPGPGGYYIPALIQMYLVLPFMCEFFLKRPGACSVLVALFVAILEVLTVAGAIPFEIYRLLIVRYGLYLLLGLHLYRLYRIGFPRLSFRNFFCLIFVFLAGGLYLLLINYFGVPPLSADGFRSTSSVCVLYVAPVFCIALSCYCNWERKAKTVLLRRVSSSVSIGSAVQFLSKAALHIYIFQMLFYYFISPHAQWFVSLPLAAFVLLCIAVCTLGGVFHYLIEQKMRVYLKSKAVGLRIAA